ncbi:Yip1 family protein [Streptomyces sp. NPDC089799]|uniref:Yip1 family protein n=1 Tax=Streptomyces sp. NPDC089799 TaxID=3155066 RepID=UPI00344460C4
MNQPKRAVVDPPDVRGLREVRVDGVTVGRAWSMRELRRILVRAGFPPKTDPALSPAVAWYGAGPAAWPDRPLRRRATMGLLVAGLLGSALMLVDIGLPDVLGALTFAGRVTGCMFIAGGFLQVVAAAAVPDHWGKRGWKYSGAVALVGVVIALVVCSLLLALWLQEKELFPYFFAYLALWFWSLWAAWRVCRERPWRGLPHPRRFAVGVTASGLLALVNLAYSGVYQPAAAQVRVNYQVAFGTPYADSSRDPVTMHVPVTVTLENTGTVPFWLLGSVVTVHGKRSQARPDDEVIRDWREGHGESELYEGPPEYNPVHWGPLDEPGSWIDPGARLVRQTLVRLPRNAPFDALEGRSRLILMRKDRGSVDSTFSTSHWSWEPDRETGRVDCTGCGDIGINLGRLRYNSNLLNVTRKPRHVLSIRYVNSDVDEDMNVIVSPMDAAGRIAWDPEPEDRLDLVEMGSGITTVSFAQLLKQLR